LPSSFVLCSFSTTIRAWPRTQASAARNAILNTRLDEFADRLAVDCGNAECGGERIYKIGDLARTHGERTLMGNMVIRLRCRPCGKAPVACAIEKGPSWPRVDACDGSRSSGLSRGDER
jgi:hypothetical protein